MKRFDLAPHEHSVDRMRMLEVAAAALDAVDPRHAVAGALAREDGTLRVAEHSFELGDFRRVLIIGFGKAAVPMGRAAVEAVRGAKTAGVLVTPVVAPVDGLEVLPGSHPVPDDYSRAGGRRVLRMASRAAPSDLVIVLISGGGSALLAVPAEGVTLDDLKSTNTALLYSGANIGELNTVRKHLSDVKGGRLAEALSKAGGLITLILSDVIGNPLNVIASGPTVPDPTTYADALSVLDRYQLRDQVSRRVIRHLEEGIAGEFPDTPDGGAIFDRQVIQVVADAKRAADAALEAAGRHGPARIVTTELQGEARDVARRVVGEAGDLQPGGMLVYTGETTVTVAGDGRGGRNQELALAAAIELEGRSDVTVLSLGTDGIDGMTTSAGAFADGTAVARGAEIGLDAREHLDRNDSGPYLTAIGDTVDSGPTGTNVGDLILVEKADG